MEESRQWIPIMDGDSDRASHDGDEFTLLHFRQHLTGNVEERRRICWNRIISEKLMIPAISVKVYERKNHVQ